MQDAMQKIDGYAEERGRGGGDLRLAHGGLVVEQIASMRVLEAVLGEDRGSLDTERDEILAEVGDALSELGGAAETSGRVAVAAPEKLGKRSGTRPNLAGNNGVVDLLAPEWRSGTDDAAGFLSGEVGGNVEAVDALPCLVWCAPRAAGTAVVEAERSTGRVWVHLGVVARIVADISTVAAVCRSAEKGMSVLDSTL